MELPRPARSTKRRRCAFRRYGGQVGRLASVPTLRRPGIDDANQHPLEDGALALWISLSLPEPPALPDVRRRMDDKSINLWRQIESCRRAMKLQERRGKAAAPLAGTAANDPVWAPHDFEFR